MHPFIVLVFAGIVFAGLGVVAAIAALVWSWRRPESWGSVVLATLGGLLMLPMGMFLGFAAAMKGLPAESQPVALAWAAGFIFVSLVWVTTGVRAIRSTA